MSQWTRVICAGCGFPLGWCTCPKPKPDAAAVRITEYTIGDRLDPERVTVNDVGHGRWAVRRLGYCLNRSGEWEHEPTPSSRDDAFFARCRWPSSAEAIAAARAILARGI